MSSKQSVDHNRCNASSSRPHLCITRTLAGEACTLSCAARIWWCVCACSCAQGCIQSARAAVPWSVASHGYAGHIKGVTQTASTAEAGHCTSQGSSTTGSSHSCFGSRTGCNSRDGRKTGPRSGPQVVCVPAHERADPSVPTKAKK
jgi:hypothetical protein